MPRPLDIIVPIYRNAELTRACILSILAHWGEVAERQPRLVLINDSPDDNDVVALLGEITAGRDRVLLLTNPQNQGFVRTVNRGLELAQKAGRDALLVNSDTLTFAGTLFELLLAAEADEQIGFASPRSNNASLCSLPHFHGGTLVTPDEAHRRWKTLSATMPPWHFVPTGVGFYLYIAHRVLADHGVLRTEFGVGYEEENDLVMRAGKVGTRAILANHAFAFHAGSASFSLTGIDLDQHRRANQLKLVAQHPEFLPLVRRYESSAHFRAERLMAGLLPDERGRLRVCFDLTGLGQHFNGTNEHAAAALAALVPRWRDRLVVTGIATEASFKFHGLDKIEGLHRADPGSAGLHAVAIRLSQPFDLHHINVLDGLAPINVFAMLDTIAEDCGPLAVPGDFLELWDFVAEHANGFLYNSRFTEREFLRRHPAAQGRPGLAMLLSTRVEEYRRDSAQTTSAGHLLVLGNHFPHKASDAAGRRLAAAFPSLSVVALGSEDRQSGNLQIIKPGLVSDSRMRELYSAASVVVLPSHIEGFGLGLMHALAAGKAVAARSIPATLEVLACLDEVQGVELFESNEQMVATVQRALKGARSRVGSSRGPGWNDWADGLGALCQKLAAAQDVFARLTRRLQAGDVLRQAVAYRQSREQASLPAAAGTKTAADVPATSSLEALMALDGSAFVMAAYRTLLQREADDAGLAFYAAEVESGIGKLQVLGTLAASPEGRARGVELEGLARALAAAEKPRPSLAGRVRRRLGLR